MVVKVTEDNSSEEGVTLSVEVKTAADGLAACAEGVAVDEVLAVDSVTDGEVLAVSVDGATAGEIFAVSDSDEPSDAGFPALSFFCCSTRAVSVARRRCCSAESLAFASVATMMEEISSGSLLAEIFSITLSMSTVVLTGDGVLTGATAGVLVTGAATVTEVVTAVVLLCVAVSFAGVVAAVGVSSSSSKVPASSGS